jgi:hypothetical protein
MTAATRKRRKDDAKEEFFLYVAFHAAFTALVNLFKDD